MRRGVTTPSVEAPATRRRSRRLPDELQPELPKSTPVLGDLHVVGVRVGGVGRDVVVDQPFTVSFCTETRTLWIAGSEYGSRSTDQEWC